MSLTVARKTRRWKERRKTATLDGWTARRRYEDDSRYLEEVDVEFITNRRTWIKGQVRIDEKDKTLIQGIPTEWVLREPEARALVDRQYIEDKPLDWFEE